MYVKQGVQATFYKCSIYTKYYCWDNLLSTNIFMCSIKICYVNCSKCLTQTNMVNNFITIFLLIWYLFGSLYILKFTHFITHMVHLSYGEIFANFYHKLWLPIFQPPFMAAIFFKLRLSKPHACMHACCSFHRAPNLVKFRLLNHAPKQDCTQNA
jgi:hypothetical protein